MHAIPTKYRGISFRSRLEARWAIFFDALEIKYDYEPEAYDLDGLNYLPDFWLPDQEIFIEIKPDVPPDDGDEVEKCIRLAKFTRHSVIMEIGSPRFIDYGSSDWPVRYCPEGADFPYLWCECPHCHRLDKQFDGRADRIKCRCQKSTHGDKGYNHDAPRIMRAFDEARTYRFWSPTT